MEFFPFDGTIWPTLTLTIARLQDKNETVSSLLDVSRTTILKLEADHASQLEQSARNMRKRYISSERPTLSFVWT